MRNPAKIGPIWNVKQPKRIAINSINMMAESRRMARAGNSIRSILRKAPSTGELFVLV